LIDAGSAAHYMVIENSRGDEYGVCVFDDLSYCGQWELLRAHAGVDGLQCTAGLRDWPEDEIRMDTPKRYIIDEDEKSVTVLVRGAVEANENEVTVSDRLSGPSVNQWHSVKHKQPCPHCYFAIYSSAFSIVSAYVDQA
jgi:hypothetical protein